MPDRRVSSCRWCGAPLHQSGIGRPKQFCSHAHRSRAYDWNRLVGAPVSLPVIAARNGYRCGICTGVVDLTAEGQLGPSIDHIIPVTAGGGNALGNLQLAHMACNTRKSNRTGFACDPIGAGDPPLTLF